GAQLPAIGTARIAGLRRYPDQPNLADEVDSNGLIGSREEREALVPTGSGELRLPAIEVVWWNTLEDRLERTTLAARTLQVAPNANLDQPPLEPPPAGPRPRPHVLLWPWQLSTALFALTTALGFALWWR